MYRQDVALFQICEPAVITSVQSFRTPDIGNCVPNKGVAVCLTLGRIVETKHALGIIVIARNHRARVKGGTEVREPVASRADRTQFAIKGATLVSIR